MKSVTTGLHGPHPLTHDSVDRAVRGTGPGAYALGHVGSNDVFYVTYVGRSDTNLNKRLHEHIGAYKEFKFGLYDTAKQAFEKECELYHDFNQTDNDVHPARPVGTNYRCPVLGCNA